VIVRMVEAHHHQRREERERAMQRSLMWIGTAALLEGILSGQGEVVGMTVPHGANGPADDGIARVWPRNTPRHDRFEATRHAPSASSCQRDSARSDVFECESNNGSN
jgi:hypothetical protein